MHRFIQRLLHGYEDDECLNGDSELSEPLICSLNMPETREEYMWSVEPKLTRYDAPKLMLDHEEVSFKALTIIAWLLIAFMTSLLVCIYIHANNESYVLD